MSEKFHESGSAVRKEWGVVEGFDIICEKAPLDQLVGAEHVVLETKRCSRGTSRFWVLATPSDCRPLRVPSVPATTGYALPACHDLPYLGIP
jgi:hypothetical protein